MSHVFHRDLRQRYPVAVGGDGVYLIDSDGRRYLDASGGAAVSCLGHSDTAVRRRIKAQIDRLAYVHSAFFTTEPMERLAEHLAKRAPGDLDSVYFVSGGSEAVEAALKMARQYFLEVGQPDRCKIIARRQSYHGNTLGALATGGNLWRRRQFEPMLAEVTHVSPCYAYRDQHPGEATAEYCRRLLRELEAAIQRLGPESVMAFVAEPVVGATLGAVPPIAGYFAGVRQLCDRYGILLILDEVMCGMGRTGSLFACQQEGIAPDLLCIAKGLGAGYQPIGAVLVDRRIRTAFEAGSGFFQHGHTYIGHATACTAALAVLESIEERNLLEQVRVQGDGLQERLTRRFSGHPHVGDIRGRGLFIGLELVADRDSKAPFPAAARIAGRLKATAMENGLLCYPMSGTIDGQSGDHVLLAPPFIIEDGQLDELVDRLAGSIDATIHREMS